VAIAEPLNLEVEVRSAGAGLVHADTVAGTTEAMRRWLVLSAVEKQLIGSKGLKLFAEQ